MRVGLFVFVDLWAEERLILVYPLVSCILVALVVGLAASALCMPDGFPTASGRCWRLWLYRSLFPLENFVGKGIELFLESLQSSVVQVVPGLECEAGLRGLKVGLKRRHLDLGGIQYPGAVRTISRKSRRWFSAVLVQDLL